MTPAYADDSTGAFVTTALDETALALRDFGPQLFLAVSPAHAWIATVTSRAGRHDTIAVMQKTGSAWRFIYRAAGESGEGFGSDGAQIAAGLVNHRGRCQLVSLRDRSTSRPQYDLGYRIQATVSP